MYPSPSHCTTTLKGLPFVPTTYTHQHPVRPPAADEPLAPLKEKACHLYSTSFLVFRTGPYYTGNGRWLGFSFQHQDMKLSYVSALALFVSAALGAKAQNCPTIKTVLRNSVRSGKSAFYTVKVLAGSTALTNATVTVRTPQTEG